MKILSNQNAYQVGMLDTAHAINNITEKDDNSKK